MEAATNRTQAHCEIRFTRPNTDTLCVQLAGKWSIHVALPSTAEMEAQLGGAAGAAPHVRHAGTHRLGQRLAHVPAQARRSLRAESHRR